MIGEMHCHTNLSLPKWAHKTLPTPKALVDKCLALGLDFACITDHDIQGAFEEATEYAKEKGIVLVPSVEITTKPTPIMRRRAHILAYGVEKKIDSFLSVEETISLIHEQDGLAVLAHPFSSKFAKLLYVGQQAGDYNFDGLEVFNSQEIFPEDNYKAQSLAVMLGLVGYCGSDAHTLLNLGHSRMEVDIPKTKDWRKIVKGLRDGKVNLYQTDYNSYHRRHKLVHWALRKSIPLPKI